MFVLPEKPLIGNGAYFHTPSGASVMFLFVGYKWVHWVNGHLTEKESLELDAVLALEKRC